MTNFLPAFSFGVGLGAVTVMLFFAGIRIGANMLAKASEQGFSEGALMAGVFASTILVTPSILLIAKLWAET